MIVASLDHNQVAELYSVRAELEGSGRLAARHATVEEHRVLDELVREQVQLDAAPEALVRANRRFHHQVHLASHNRYLVQQLDIVHRSMALMETTSLAIAGRMKLPLMNIARWFRPSLSEMKTLHTKRSEITSQTYLSRA